MPSLTPPPGDADMALARRALDEWFGAGHWPPVHKLDALIASVAWEARREAYVRCLQLADDMTNQRALIRDLMKLAGVEKFTRTTKCLVCGKKPRAEDGGMLCQPCRDAVDGMFP